MGRELFYEKALSDDLTLSCGSCHVQANAFADPRAFSEGTDGSIGMRNAMSLVNLAWARSHVLGWSRAGLGGASARPGDQPGGDAEHLARGGGPPERERQVPPALPSAAFGTEQVDSTLVTRALAQFVRSLVSFDSPFDRFWFGGDSTALSEQAQNGLALFTSQGKCAGCHAPGLFTDNALRNNGLDVVLSDAGFGAVTGDPADMGKFKVPTLRNIAVTAPYMHDARFATPRSRSSNHYNGGVHMNFAQRGPAHGLLGHEPHPLLAR